MRFKTAKTMASGLCIILATCTAHSTTVLVDGRGGAPDKFPTISAALAALNRSDGQADVIQVAAATKETNSVLIKFDGGDSDSLEIIGVSNAVVVFGGGVGDYAVQVSGSPSARLTMRNLTLVPEFAGGDFPHGGVSLRLDGKPLEKGRTGAILLDDIVVTSSLAGDIPAGPARRPDRYVSHASWKGGERSASFLLEDSGACSVHFDHCLSAQAGSAGFWLTQSAEGKIELSDCAARFGESDGIRARECEGPVTMSRCESSWNKGLGFMFESGRGALELRDCRLTSNTGRGLQIGENSNSSVPRGIAIISGNFSDNGWTDYNLSPLRKYEYGALFWGGTACAVDIRGTAENPVLFMDNYCRGVRIDNPMVKLRRIEYAIFAGRHRESGLQLLQLDLSTAPEISHCAFVANAGQSQAHSQLTIAEGNPKPVSINISDCTFYNAVGNGYHHIAVENFNEHPPENLTLHVQRCIFAGGPAFQGSDERALDLDGNHCAAEFENCALVTQGPYSLTQHYLEADLSGEDNRVHETNCIHADPNFYPSRCTTQDPSAYSAAGTFLRPQSAAYAAAGLGGFNLHPGPDAPPIKPVRVAVYSDLGPGKIDVFQTLRILQGCTDVSFEEVKARDIWTGCLDRCDVIMFPGGSSETESSTLKAKGRAQLRSFVQRGGGYIGTCAGAYLLMPGSLRLDMLDARSLDYEHWARGHGIVEIKLNPLGQEILGSPVAETEIEYWQGPLIAPISQQPGYQPLATYVTEIHSNGAPSGVMAGSTAIAAGSYGEGRYVAISCHPEGVITPLFRSDYVYHAILWAAKRTPPLTGEIRPLR